MSENQNCNHETLLHKELDIYYCVSCYKNFKVENILYGRKQEHDEDCTCMVCEGK